MRGLASLLCLLFRNCRFELTATLERSRRWFTPSLLVLLQANPSTQMGCCSSKSSVDEDDPLTGTGVCQKQLHPPHTSTTGLQVIRVPGTTCATTTTSYFAMILKCCHRSGLLQPVGWQLCLLWNFLQLYFWTTAFFWLSSKATAVTRLLQHTPQHQLSR